MSTHREQTGINLHKPGYIQSSDPGAIGAGKVWIDTTGGTGAWLYKVRNAADTGWETLGSSGAVEYPQRAQVFSYDMVQSVGTWTHNHNTNMDYYYFLQSPNSDGQKLKFSVFLEEADDYTIQILGIVSTNRPIMDIEIDGSVVDSIDWYNGSTVYNTWKTVTDVEIVGNGNHLIELVTNGKTGSDYYMSLTTFAMFRAAESGQS